MRMIVAAFILGAIVAAVNLLVVRQFTMAKVVNQVEYRFDTCVFGTPYLPDGDLANGRLIRRLLAPVEIHTRFFDTNFNEVGAAEKPGRYGAVVKMDFGAGVTTYRFITLYRTPKEVRADFTHIPITAQIPADFGVDPTVVAAQQAEIGKTLENAMFSYEESASPESMAILLSWLAETPPNAPPAHLHDGPYARNEAWWYQLQTKLGLETKYKYLLDLPQGYAADPNKRWPLIMFLHSSDQGGDDLSQVRGFALAGQIARGWQVPAIVVSPQCPEAQTWSIQVLAHLLDSIQAQYRVDPDRVYLTGASSGGDITWDLALLQPERFAAIVPMSGETDLHDAAQLKNVPVWGFNGGRDEAVPPQQMQWMVEAVRQAGGHAHLTLYPNDGHDCWEEAYNTDALWTWLLAQKRGQPEVRTPGTPTP